MTNELHNTTDAADWAKAFIIGFSGYMIQAEGLPDTQIVDEGTMIAWFANAIETGRMHPDSSALMRILIGEHFDLYLNNAEFHHAINWLVRLIPGGIQALAASCAEQQARDEEAVRVMESEGMIRFMRLDDPPESDETLTEYTSARECRAVRWNGTPSYEGSHEHHMFTYGPTGTEYTGHCGGVE